MRITNKVMQNNALTNINRNKELQDKLNTELATGKKVDRPSDDPVVAIRALRLRSDVSQISQYYKKNVPDAKSWLELTESSIKTSVSVVKDMIEQCEKGSNDTLKTEDRKIIIDALKELRNEVYATGDADYAGRYIFTGYRTDTSLTFRENEKTNFEITEMFTGDDLEKITYIEKGNLANVSESNYMNGTAAVASENDVQSHTYYRFRASYDNLSQSAAPFTNGTTTYNVTAVDDPETAYKDAEGGKEVVYFVKSTGEYVMSEDVYNDIKAAANQEETRNFTVKYEKNDWKIGDLRPQHYFQCVQTTDKTGKDLEFVDSNGDTNPSPISYNMGPEPEYGQPIEYQVGFNQYIQVNTYANEIFQHDIGRDVDEIIDLANNLNDTELLKTKLDKMYKAVKDDESKVDEAKALKSDLDAADKATTLLKDQLQKTFSKYITKMQDYLNATNEAVTTVGGRSKRLDLIENRLEDQTTTFKTLQSENEDADATEVAVQLSSAKINYEAALMSTGQMIQKTLLNYL